jgi:hypothetical protein
VEYTFKEHKLSRAERLWLEEALQAKTYDARLIKVRLLGKIPRNFDPKKIDGRVWNNGTLTLVGLWHVRPGDPLFHDLDAAIKAIREEIISRPGFDSITSAKVAELTGLDQKSVGHALYCLGELGRFFSGANGTPSEPYSYSSINLAGEDGYDAYLAYENIWELLEHFYVERRKIAELGHPAALPPLGEAGSDWYVNWGQPRVALI